MSEWKILPKTAVVKESIQAAPDPSSFNEPLDLEDEVQVKIACDRGVPPYAARRFFACQRWDRHVMTAASHVIKAGEFVSLECEWYDADDRPERIPVLIVSAAGIRTRTVLSKLNLGQTKE
jgi:hypothetical protein